MRISGASSGVDCHIFVCVLKPSVASALTTGGMYDCDEFTLRIDAGVSRRLISDIGILSSWNPGAKNAMFNTAAGTTITSREVGTLKLKAYDDQRKQQNVSMNGAYCVPHKSHILVAMGQLSNDW